MYARLLCVANRPRLPTLAALGAVGWLIGRRNRLGRGG